MANIIYSAPRFGELEFYSDVKNLTNPNRKTVLLLTVALIRKEMSARPMIPGT